MLRNFTLSVFFFGLFSLTACNNNQTLDRPIPDPGRTITHARGETVVPLNPDRVIALDNIALDSVLALDVEPIAALINPNTNDFPVHLRDKIPETTEKLSPNQQNLERITELNPDLIIGGKNVEAVYNQLNQIAPTVLLGESGTSAWKEKLLLTAEALGQPEKGEVLLQEYQERAQTLASRLENPDTIEVSVVRVLPNGLRLYQNDTFIGGILKDVGLSRPPSQDEADLWLQISRERMELADGDVIFVWSLGEEAATTRKRLEDDPLWSKLDAVQAGEVYEVPGYWIGRGPIAANRVLADLEKHLLKEETIASESQQKLKTGQGEKDIVDIASSNENLSTLAQAVQAADLAETLKGDGPFTIFAPTNEAFAKLPNGFVEFLLQPKNKDLLVDVLTYHVVPSRVTSDQLETGKVESLNSGIAVAVSGNRVIVNDASVIQPDVQASNGVIHTVNRVLLPEGLTETIQSRMNQ